MTDLDYMKRCFHLASLGRGYTQSNPVVGSVIVYNNRILGEGYHTSYGSYHAEVEAIRSVGPEDLPLLSESTLYVNLEPCCHFGKTPPCTDEIIRHKIKRVVIGCLDPNPKVNGKGFHLLRQAGIEVAMSKMSKEAENLNRIFISTVKNKKPYVILKFAKSSDGFMGSPDKQIQISNSWSQYAVHKIRHEVQAILIGTNTAIIDNPQLTNRLYFGSNPLRIILDQHGKIPTNYTIFTDGHPTWLFTDRPLQYPSSVIVYPWYHSLEELLQRLFALGVHSLLVEGGSQVLQSFIREHKWDELWQNTNPLIIHEGIKAPLFTGQLQHRFYFGEDCLEVFIPLESNS